MSSSPDRAAGNGDPALVVIVNEDAAMRETLCRMLRPTGHQVLTFAAPAELLSASLPDLPTCALLDFAWPSRDGLELQEALIARGAAPSIVFLAQRADVPATVRAMRAGAIDFLITPVCSRVLLTAVAAAIVDDAERRRKARMLQDTRERVSSLTLRERQVLKGVVEGRINKVIAHDLGISTVTIKLHRRNLTRKLCAKKPADLVKAWIILDNIGTRGARESLSAPTAA